MIKKRIIKKVHKFPYKWNLKNTVFTKDKGTVFSCFACGGGSTMGYKLAGFDVLGCNEIDPKMMEVYIKNHKPKYSYLESIRDFKNRTDLPKELYSLDILDGSPPCSTFSMAGNREKDWGKEKKFTEGQEKQVLDTLFFDFIDVAEKLQPKIVIAENVKGLQMGNAKKYIYEIGKHFDTAGYYVEKWLLDASTMGVPQRRERIFFIAIRKDLAQQFNKKINLVNNFPQLSLQFNEPKIFFKDFRDNIGIDKSHTIRGQLMEHRIKTDKTLNDINLRLYKKTSGFNAIIMHDNKLCPTLVSGEYNWRYYDGMMCTNKDYILMASFPLNFNFLNVSIKYVVGMSVPPVMIANIVTKVYQQILCKIKEEQLCKN